MKILYFAWLRELIGHGEAEIVVPAGVVTVGDMTGFIAGLTPGHARAFADRAAIKMALDQTFVTPETALGDARELAYFPPFTGG